MAASVNSNPDSDVNQRGLSDDAIGRQKSKASLVAYELSELRITQLRCWQSYGPEVTTRIVEDGAIE